MQWSNFSPRSAAHCSSLGVPLTAMPSSSPVIRKEIEPFFSPVPVEMIEHGGERAGDAALHVDGAAAVKLAPSISPPKGGCAQAVSSPGGTTSVWPANTRLGASLPMRA